MSYMDKYVQVSSKTVKYKVIWNSGKKYEWPNTFSATVFEVYSFRLNGVINFNENKFSYFDFYLYAVL